MLWIIPLWLLTVQQYPVNIQQGFKNWILRIKYISLRAHVTSTSNTHHTFHFLIIFLSENSGYATFGMCNWSLRKRKSDCSFPDVVVRENNQKSYGSGNSSRFFFSIVCSSFLLESIFYVFVFVWNRKIYNLWRIWEWMHTDSPLPGPGFSLVSFPYNNNERWTSST